MGLSSFPELSGLFFYLRKGWSTMGWVSVGRFGSFLFAAISYQIKNSLSTPFLIFLVKFFPEYRLAGPGHDPRPLSGAWARFLQPWGRGKPAVLPEKSVHRDGVSLVIPVGIPYNNRGKSFSEETDDLNTGRMLHG